MSLAKHIVECPDCGQSSTIIKEVSEEAPKYCPECGSDLDDEVKGDDS